jgi:uncharacterized membrane protein (UPF0127 family)
MRRIDLSVGSAMNSSRQVTTGAHGGWMLVLALLVLLAFMEAPRAAADVANPEPLSAFPQSLLAVRTTTGSVVNFKIWTADRPSRQEQGLMYIRDMDEHAGMLFVFPADEQVSMWMKNTYLSLDMVFIDAAGRIVYIAPKTTPLSLDIISTPQPTRAVLELKGGACAAFGIAVGDRVIHSSFTMSNRSK